MTNYDFLFMIMLILDINILVYKLINILVVI